MTPDSPPTASPNAADKAAPDRLRSPWQRFLAWLDMFFVDHGLFRAAYNNLHALPGGLYRASQPTPRQIRKYQQKYGIKTIINLRGADQTPRYALHEDTCRALGITLVNHKGILSRSAPEVDAVLATKEMFDNIEYPALIHCKSGADRAGFASALYRMFRLHDPVTKAEAELDWRYGHFKGSKTGILDFFFEEYQAFNEKQPTDFMTWLTQHYDRDALKSKFKAGGAADFVVDKVLHRE
ncbi:tyrosine-protein phosphatase [Uliginosibacterium sp. H3]|uniref:Tyrosine-protein phosphatase n=1 Tax=Uliginosibacterium silvisoli TaxID=3114758 RepID=A0ABU6K957_9RHOO|nr:tyrosine-protein phosphatase [Uliginosibacterium sp. H3]